MANIRLSEVPVSSRGPANALRVFADNTERDAYEYADADLHKIIAVGSGPYTYYLISDVSAGVATFVSVSGGGGADLDGITIDTGAKTGNFNFLANYLVRITGSSLPFTGTLPGSPSNGDRVGFYFDFAAPTGTFTIARNGNTIQGFAFDAVALAAVNGSIVWLRYNGVTWVVDSSAADWVALTVPPLDQPSVIVRTFSGGIPVINALALSDDDCLLVRKNAEGGVSKLAVPANTFVSHSTRPNNSGNGLNANGPLDAAKILVNVVHWSNGNISGNFAAEANRGYFLTPNPGQIVDLPDLTTVEDGTPICFVKNESGTDATDFTPASSDKIFTPGTGPGSAGAAKTLSSAWYTVKFTASTHLGAWVYSDSI